MSSRLPLSKQTALGIFVALILGHLYQEPPQDTMIAPTSTPTLPSSSTPTPALPATMPSSTVVETSAPPRPFVTLPGVWMARVVAYPDSPPEIIKVTKLSSGRLTSSQPGDGYVRILDDEGIVIFEFTFQLSLILLDVPANVDNMTYFFIIPDFENADWLQVETPQGEATYEFLRNE